MEPMKTRALAGLLTLSMMSACFHDPRPSDSGHEDFYRQALPKVLGRRATGTSELRFLSALTDAIGPSGRRTVVRGLMNENDYVVHWEHVLADQLRVHRDPITSTQLNDCYNDNSTSSAASDDVLAGFVRDSDPSATFSGGAFSMTDLLRSSLRLDDVSPVMRASLFPLVSRPIAGANIIEKNRRDDLATRYLSTYLDRDLLCVQCHNSYSSTSGEASGWDRTFPVPGHFELALFGDHQGRALEDLSTLFRATSGESNVGGSTQPWGMRSSCGSFAAKSAVPADTYAYDPSAGPRAAHFASIHETSGPLDHSVYDLEQALRNGIQNLRRYGLRRTRPDGCRVCGSCIDPNTTAGSNYANKRNGAALALRNRCERCHDADGPGPSFLMALGDDGSVPGDWDTPLVRVTGGSGSAYIHPREASASYIVQRIERGEMPPGGMPDTERAALLDTLRAYIEAMPESAGCDMCAPEACEEDAPTVVREDDALAYLTAASLVSNTFEELFGYPLTIANHFPRNSEEMGRLWNLTEYGLLSRRGWSMKKVIERLVLSSMFNRLAPAEGDGDEPYEIVPVLEPWSVADPRVVSSPAPEEEYNAMTDGIHAHTAWTRLRMLHRALGWPEPKRVASGFPDQTFQMEIGQYVDDAKPGFSGIDFAGLLSWEDHVGRCQKPAGVARDFIDDLLEDVAAGPSSPFAPGYTVGEVAVAIKDRILNDAHLTPAELATLPELFGVASLAQPASGASLGTAAREYCGVLLQSPQFLLAGLPPPSTGDEPADIPRLSQQSFREACEAHAPAFLAQGLSVECHPDHVAVRRFVPTVLDRLGRLCAQGACGLVDPAFLKSCAKGLAQCMPSFPACDPSCTGPTCCGEDPGTLLSDTSDVLTTALEGAIVKTSKGVWVYALDKQQTRELKEGEELSFGQVLLVTPGAELVVSLGDEIYATPKGGAKPPQEKKGEKLYDTKNPWQLLVTGPSALKYLPKKPPHEGVVPYGLLKVQRRAGTFRTGTAGTPLSPHTPQRKLTKAYPESYQARPPEYELRPLIEAKPKELPSDDKGEGTLAPTPKIVPQQLSPSLSPSPKLDTRTLRLP